ncbi:MAG TPA: T9SS type A sorting domain-containing protein, partial [Saprospiraceae bacterium]|nr:T9SS type A sorting domain-containing protein [Saprospiraceae bacterium]
VIHNIANCNTKLNRVYDLMRWQEELENNENGFAGSALDNFLTIHKGEPEVFCASIRYCKRDYTIQWTDFYYVNCQPVNTNCIPNTVENVYYEPCTIATDPNVWPFPSSPQIICDVNGCPQLHTPFPDYPRGYNFIDENNPNLIVTHITENQNDQEFMDFGFHRIENMISPKPIFRTGDHYELNDYVWNQKEIQTRKLDLPLKALYIEIDTFKAFILTELVPNKEYEFRQAVDTLNYILNIKSTGSLKIEKTFRQDKVTKIIGTFSGILKLDTTQISTYKENNIFYLDINDNGNVVQYHLIDNIRANSKIAITNRSNSIRIDGYAKSNVIILNGLTTTLTNPDSSFHLLVSENGISTNNANYIVQGTVSQIKNTSFNKKKSAAMVFKGQGRLFIGSAVFNLNGTKALFIEVDSTNSILWSKYVPIELIQENKFDIIFDSKGNLIAALTTNTNGQIDSLHIINGGGDDINFFIVDSTGDIFGAKRFCSSGMENIKKLFYDRGFIYFGGEFKNDSTFVFIGHNEYYNVSKNLQHAYTSFIIANDFESPQSNGSPQSPEKISQNNFLSLNNISIYPNPTSGEVAINLDLIKESNVKYLLIDINGIERDAGDFNNKFKNEIIVNKLKSLDAGIYFLKIYINDKLEKVEKLIKI